MTISFEILCFCEWIHGFNIYLWPVERKSGIEILEVSYIVSRFFFQCVIYIYITIPPYGGIACLQNSPHVRQNAALTHVVVIFTLRPGHIPTSLTRFTRIRRCFHANCTYICLCYTKLLIIAIASFRWLFVVCQHSYAHTFIHTRIFFTLSFSSLRQTHII